jgi:hypothetical protein
MRSLVISCDARSGTIAFVFMALLRDRIRDKDKDPSFSAKPTRAKD